MDMDIRIANICYYHDQEEKLIQDIQQVSFFDMNMFQGLYTNIVILFWHILTPYHL